MSVDFLVCTKGASVVAAVELNDAAHARPDRISAVEKKERALNAARVRPLRWSVDAMPDESGIQRAFATPPTGRRDRIPSELITDALPVRGSEPIRH